jgi:hypothetical protein
MTSIVDRQNAARALAKAIAYRDCGKDEDAERWAITLLSELQCLGIVKPDTLSRYHDGQ